MKRILLIATLFAASCAKQASEDDDMADLAAAELNKVSLYKSQVQPTLVQVQTLPSEYLKLSDSLVTNGSFELPVLSGMWATFDTGAVPGWQASWLDATCTTTPQIELQHKDLLAIDTDFNQYAEVDADNACTTDARIKLTQNVATETNHIYQLTFRMRARDSEHAMGLAVTVDEFATEFTPTTEWKTVTLFFEATSATTGLAFSDAAAGDTFGPIIDAVEVREVTVDTDAMPKTKLDGKKPKKGGKKRQSFEGGRRHKDCKNKGEKSGSTALEKK